MFIYYVNCANRAVLAMEPKEKKIEEQYKLGLCQWIFKDFAAFLRHEGLEVSEIDKDGAQEDLLGSLDAVIIDLAGEDSDKLDACIAAKVPDVPRILITEHTEDLFEDKGAFALLHRPVTAIELLDVTLWACEYKRASANDPSIRRITEHPRIDVFLEETARELLPSTRWLSAIFDYLPLGLILVSSDGSIIRANNSILQDLGFEKISAGDNCNNVVPWRGIEDLGCLVPECLAQNEVLRDSFELTDGRFLEVIHVPVVSDGIMTGVLIIIQDVSPEESLTSRFMNVAGVIDEGIAIVDKEMRYVWINDTMKQWFDIGEDYTEKQCSSVLGEDRGLCANCSIMPVFEDGLVHHSYVKAKTAMGEERTFEIIAGPVKNRAGKIKRAVKILRDVTNREKIINTLATTKSRLEDANAELSQRLNELRMLTELSEALQTVESLEENLYIFLTAVTAKQGCGFNRAFLFLVDRSKNLLSGRLAIGPSSAEEAGQIWHELESHPAKFADVLASYRKGTEGGDIEVNRIIKDLYYNLSDKNSLLVNCLFSKQTLIVDKENRPPGADELAVKLQNRSFAVVPLLAMGKPVGIVVADNKLSNAPIDNSKVDLLKAIASHGSLTIERSQLLGQLREQNVIVQEAYQRLQENQDILIRTERLSTIGKFSAQVAHEIRNPLVSIGGFAKNIAKRVEPESPIRRYSNIIWDEAKRLEDILEDVLSYSRQAEPKIRSYDLNKLVLRTIDILSELAEKNSILVTTNLAEEIDSIPMDPDQIRQVVMNLVKNGIAAMPKGGTLTVTTRRAGGFVWLDVTDTGEGIAEKFQDKIFEPFFTTKSSGTGLGLSISYQIIDAHGGMIWFTTTPKKGTTFHIKLPSGEKKF